MEIIFELVVQLFIEFIPAVIEILAGVVGEVLLQIFGEGLFEVGFRGLTEAFDRRKRRNPFLAAIGYLLWGAIIGGLSLLVFRDSLIHRESLRLLNLIVAPVVAGIMMSVVGAYRRKRGQNLMRIDSFFYGYLFAIGMAVVRFLFAG